MEKAELVERMAEAIWERTKNRRINLVDYDEPYSALIERERKPPLLQFAAVPLLKDLRTDALAALAGVQGSQDG